MHEPVVKVVVLMLMVEVVAMIEATVVEMAFVPSKVAGSRSTPATAHMTAAEAASMTFTTAPSRKSTAATPATAHMATTPAAAHMTAAEAASMTFTTASMTSATARSRKSTTTAMAAPTTSASAPTTSTVD